MLQTGNVCKMFMNISCLISVNPLSCVFKKKPNCDK